MDREPIVGNGFGDDGSPPVEVKKELSDEMDELNANFMDDMDDDDCITSNDGIFEVIPFMARLLSNLKCSFYSRSNEIVIASIELLSVHELIQRLLKNRIRPSRMNCCSDSTFTLSICDDQFTKPVTAPSGAAAADACNIIRYLPIMAIAMECANLALIVDRSEIHIRSICYDSLAGLMARLKQYDILPKQVDSLKNSLFSLVFSSHSFVNVDDILRFFPPSGGADSVALRRPRICPNYLRDYVVEQHKDEPVSGLDLVSSNGLSSMSRISFPGGLLPQKTAPSGGGSHSKSSDDAPPVVVKRGRGRPRIRPEPSAVAPANTAAASANADLSLDSSQAKKPRGRPRRSDIVPSIIARTNSFINIQPKGMSAQEIENCFVKFLESDISAFRQPK